MTNAVYPIYKTAILTAAANTSLDQNNTTDGPFLALSDTNVVAYNIAQDFYDDVASATVGTPGRIVNPTVGAVTGGGTFDGDNVTFSAVVGAVSEALIVYRHNSGLNSTWRLVLYLDTSVTGLPVTPNGGDIVVAFLGIRNIHDMSDPLYSQNIAPDAQRELFAALSKAASGFSAEQVAGAAMNLLLNALRQTYPTQEAAAKAFDEAAGRGKQMLLDLHYHGNGTRRNVFPFTQTIEIGPPDWSQNKFYGT